ncbi:MAG: HIT family hydrolase [Sulfurimonas sp. RIFOXYD12_FULL_33_39]|uniref:HIT family protein n=1 Tax=unclassified Sulfurimonas TaxID=2623549 RepID=UPI0008C52A58|nr:MULTISPECIES: HIT domain-containing protein [unclassified Sulfurimonas]OHE01822.1 MAG: HIT family hydrolase [Sulfurimonas sp. RIFCSPLOWO2_12_FULL_34_6]OHE09482.1 MAG: HIT family hydrolase [Sulfurimonas sp. RIFOXYD12_FULL_33_39]OHE12737.1 MAG: HIT family hydrolase [Sulfurimonas sp. RIFOXYD2_FULL_34_21]DAB28575.1 MAG TPA: HIT family hydrolase [Sulfurimonas sp. UBA10385]
MKDILYAPWRDEYINDKEIKGCVFCHISSHDMDEELHVLYRDEYCFMVMNRYPYTPGHFMIIPHVHTDKLEELDSKIWLHMSALAQKGVRLLKDGFGAKGVNIGMNLGHAGGAGIAEHIHLHLVPRWEKDTNFMTSVANNRVYSTDFEKVYKKIKSLIEVYVTEVKS